MSETHFGVRFEVLDPSARLVVRRVAQSTRPSSWTRVLSWISSILYIAIQRPTAFILETVLGFRTVNSGADFQAVTRALRRFRLTRYVS